MTQESYDEYRKLFDPQGTVLPETVEEYEREIKQRDEDIGKANARAEFERRAGIKPNEAWTTVDYHLRVTRLEQEMELQALQLRETQREKRRVDIALRWVSACAMLAIAFAIGAYYYGHHRGCREAFDEANSAARQQTHYAKQLAAFEAEQALKTDYRRQEDESIAYGRKLSDEADAKHMAWLREKAGQTKSFRDLFDPPENKPEFLDLDPRWIDAFIKRYEELLPQVKNPDDPRFLEVKAFYERIKKQRDLLTIPINQPASKK